MTYSIPFNITYRQNNLDIGPMNLPESLFFFQNGIKYELLGIGQALEFFRIEENNGQIKIAKKLREDETRQDSYRVCVLSCVSL